MVEGKGAGICVGPDDGKALPNPIGGQMVVKVRDEDSGGSYSIHDNVIPAGSPGPLPHLHRGHEETFYVLEGELTVRVGARKITAPQGSFVVIPRSVVHQPSNPQSGRRGSFSSSPPPGWSAFSRRRPREGCRCRWCRPTQRSRRGSGPSPRSTTTCSRSYRRRRCRFGVRGLVKVAQIHRVNFLGLR